MVVVSHDFKWKTKYKQTEVENGIFNMHNKLKHDRTSLSNLSQKSKSVLTIHRKFVALVNVEPTEKGEVKLRSEQNSKLKSHFYCVIYDE